MPTQIPLADVTYFEPWWIQVIKSVVIFAVVLQLVPLVLLAERKVMGRFQNRYGPNRVGPFGALQPMADIFKLLVKEQFRPRTAVGFLFAIAPAISILTACVSFAIVPFGNTVDIFGTQVGLYGLDVGIGPLYLFAFGAVAFYGFMLGGWASGSKYSFLGAMRAAAQLISYEVAMGLSLLGVVFTAGTLSLVGIVEAQKSMWFVVPQVIGFLVFLCAAFAETNRTPFDLPEAESELVQGYQTEYGGARFASFMLAEYLNITVLSGIAVTVFLGGWLLPFGIHPPGWVEPLVVLGKILIFICLFIWVRATVPRLRYDQLMSFGWKVLLPLATVNALVTAIVVVLS
jgi:NADH-quinone oxidoreductase subunit H